MPSILSYPHVDSFMKRFLAKGFLIALLNRRQMCLILRWKNSFGNRVLEVLVPFITFLHAIDISKGHNKLASMLDPSIRICD
jgi:hypothetical protein